MKASPRLDLERFSGVWHEMARLPNKAQRANDRQIKVSFVPLPHHPMQIKTTCVRENARPHERIELARRRYPIEEPGQFQRLTGPGWLRWMSSSWSDYWVLSLDKDYASLMIGEPERRDLWIYSREATIERVTLEALKSRARGLGYDLAPLLISGTLRSFQPL